jgi:anti-sigma regulatory factor (Ser/Thr protein kinase)
MRAEHHFASSVSSVRAARVFVTETLTGAPKAAVADAVLVVSELAANAVTHASSAFTICVEQTPSHVRIEVRDRGAGEPRQQHPGSEQPYGRGLHIVNELTDDWGIDTHPEGGKTVWVDLPLPQAGRASS